MALTPRRQAAVVECEWWLKNTAAIHYAQTRPMPLEKAKSHKLPLTTDCSGSVTCIYYTIGAADPNGNDYNGQGFTGTLFANGEAIPLLHLEPGDLVIRSEGDTTEHVYMVMASLGNGDFKLFSHGREAAPETVTLASAKAAHPGEGFYGKRFLAQSTQATVMVWAVVNGAGHRVAETRYPALWAARHPRMFRDYHQLKFLKQVK